jgi:hypothetical protein
MKEFEKNNLQIHSLRFASVTTLFKTFNTKCTKVTKKITKETAISCKKQKLFGSFVLLVSFVVKDLIFFCRTRLFKISYRPKQVRRKNDGKSVIFSKRRSL